MSNECPICKESYDAERIPFELDCTHTFCKFCVLDMFKRDNRCALCRKEYDIIVKLKNETEEHILNLPPLIREAIRRLPTHHAPDILNSIELLSYRICRRVQKIVDVIYSPSCEFIINDNSKLTFNMHSIVVIFLSSLIWVYLYMNTT